MGFLRRRTQPHPAGQPIARYAQWPFPEDRFPDTLGCVVPGSVLSGKRPVMQVAHAPDGSWMVADGVGDPNKAPGLTITHLRHLCDRDPSLAELAGMLPPGSQADRWAPDGPWELSPFDWPDEG